MHVIHRIEDYKSEHRPTILTIGNFDGVHRGHLAVLQRAKSLVKGNDQIVVITFSNHPAEVLRPDEPAVPRLCTSAHKNRLLEDFGVHTLISIPFTRWLAQHSAALFIENVRQAIPFSHLVLGHDATLGKDRLGKPSTMKNLGEQWGFEVHYLEEFRYEGHPISSTKIRNLLQQGNLEQVENLLGRPYSIYSSVIHGEGKGKHIGFPTANIDVTGLCLPPFGVYVVDIIKDGKLLKGIANLGVAPTVNEDRIPLLEVHIFDHDLNLYQEYIEVIFRGFVRPEQKFQNIDELRVQIEKDIQVAKSYTSKGNGHLWT